MKPLLQMATYVFLLANALPIASAKGPEVDPSRLTIGRYQSRAILQGLERCERKPAVILIPGSGANGPEEMMSADLSGDEKAHSIFAEYARGLNRAGVVTLQLGKPGIEFHTGFDQKNWFYDKAMYEGLGWQGLIDNLSDAVDYLQAQPCVDSSRVYVLGHSEGTVVATDYAHRNPGRVKGLILVGFSGESLSTTVDWQFYRRSIDEFIAIDVDTNKDGAVSKTEAAPWPDFQWKFESDDDVATFAEIEAVLRADPAIQQVVQKLRTSKRWEGVYDRAPIYSQAASLREDLFVYTGALDVQTRPGEAVKLGETCRSVGKRNCEVTIVPGLGHGMSLPRGPRRHKLLDLTLVPVEESFVEMLSKLGARL